MRVEDVEYRKNYIQNIRKSFDAPDRNYEWSKEDSTKGEATDFSFFKVRLLIAVFIFAAYVLCDQTGTLFYQYSTKDIAKKIEETYDYDKLEQTIMTFANSYAPNPQK